MLAIIVAGLSLHAAVKDTRWWLRRSLDAAAAPTAESDDSYIWQKGIAPGAQITRAITFDIEGERLRATHVLTIDRDEKLCDTIHRLTLRPEPASALWWVVGSITTDQYSVTLESVDISFDEASSRCVITAVSEPERIFINEEATSWPSDVLTFRSPAFRANSLEVVFHAKDIHIDGLTKPASNRKGKTTAFSWKTPPNNDLRSSQEVRFRLTRAVSAGPRRISDVMSRIDESSIPYLTPLLTTLLIALPYALFLLCRRCRRIPRYARLAEMTAWLLTLYLVTYITYITVSLNDWITNVSLKHLLQLRHYLSGGETYGAVLVGFVCVVWPLLIFRWVRKGTPSPILKPVGRVRAELWTAISACVAWLGIAAWGWWHVRLILPLALVAFLAASFALVREVGGGMLHLIALSATALFTYLSIERFTRGFTYALALLFLVALATLFRAGFGGSRRFSWISVTMFILVGLIGANLFIPTKMWGPYWEIWPLLDATDRWAVFAVLIAFVLVLRDHSLAGKPSRTVRTIGFALALGYLYRPRYGVYGAAVFLIGYQLLRHWLFVPRPRNERLNLHPGKIRDAIRKLIALHEAERAADGLRKSMQTQLADGSKKWSDYEEATRELEAVVSDRRNDIGAIEVSRRALANGPMLAPWERAKIAMRYASLLAIPWFLVYAAVYFQYKVPARPQWWLDFFSSLAIGAIQWPLFGFFFGYFYPEIRGNSGLSKSLVYYVTLVVPRLLVFLIFEMDRIQTAEIFPLWIFQNFIQCAILGLVAGDYLALRNAGLSWRHLRDVHNLGVLSAYGSSVLVAIGGAISAAVASGATTFLGNAFKAWVK